MLGVGGYLVIKQEATAGIIIAGSILTSRALAPVELAIAQLEGLGRRRARAGGGCSSCAGTFRRTGSRLPLPAPRKTLTVESVSRDPPGQQRIVVQDVSLRA